MRWYLDVLACAGTHSGIRTVRPDARNESGRLDPEGPGLVSLSAARLPEAGSASGSLATASSSGSGSVLSAVARVDHLRLLVVHDVMLVCLQELETGGPVSSSWR